MGSRGRDTEISQMTRRSRFNRRDERGGSDWLQSFDPGRFYDRFRLRAGQGGVTTQSKQQYM